MMVPEPPRTMREQVARERAREALCNMLGWAPATAARDGRGKVVDELVSAIVEVVEARDAARLEHRLRFAEQVDAGAEEARLAGTEYGSGD